MRLWGCLHFCVSRVAQDIVSVMILSGALLQCHSWLLAGAGEPDPVGAPSWPRCWESSQEENEQRLQVQVLSLWLAADQLPAPGLPQAAWAHRADPSSLASRGSGLPGLEPRMGVRGCSRKSWGSGVMVQASSCSPEDISLGSRGCTRDLARWQPGTEQLGALGRPLVPCASVSLLCGS